MTEGVTGITIANNIKMLRTNFEGSFLILEGGDDARLFKNFVDNGLCKPIVAINKEKALQALEIIEEENFPGVLAIVDADFMIIDESIPKFMNLLLTDTHDIETMIVRSYAYNKMLNEFGSEKKIIEFGKKHGKDTRVFILKLALSIGYLRWVSLLYSLSLDFDNLVYKNFIDKDTMTLNEENLVEEVKNKSNKHKLTSGDIVKWTNKLKRRKVDPWQVCCGHDFVHILSIGLLKALANHNTKDVEPNKLESSLRLAYEFCFFKETKLFKAIKEWEENNEPYAILST